ncbi:cytochrome P450 [Streptomyces sp. ME19-01-6]|uniref:cytochrome P450 n=1 Tax=Streptomyces sp. ME19-01-6 TaxID=3028686 RepID=UPI0029B3D831|nr:cytochrome P450 [Streptomyces sp. ME19-01-6]MDX3224889.1 cytochrome P450 [Streptomyces sp. ME19-01-6]
MANISQARAGGHQPAGDPSATVYSVAPAPGALPLLGHAVQMLFRPLDFLASLPTHGDLVRIKLGPWPVHVACHPELVHHVLASDRCFDKGGPMFDSLRKLVGDGLASCPHARHRRQRRLMQSAFHSDRLPGYARAMSEQIDEATRSWHEGQVMDVQEEMATLATRILAKTMFTADFCGPAVSAVVPYAEMITKRLTARLLVEELLPGLRTPGRRRFDRMTEALRTAVYDMAERYRADGADRGDLLSTLLAARDDDGDALSDAEVFAEVITMILAGTGTVSHTLSWAFRMLGRHPEIERRLHAEVDEVLGGRSATWDDLPDLKLAGRVFKEALRHFPSDWLVTRATAEDTELGGRALPAGSVVAYSGHIVHRRADLYPQPDRFHPDRWLDERHKPPRGAFVVFGGGGRKCIGDRFGTAEGVLALSTIAARWRLVPDRPRQARATALPTRSARTQAMRLTARR